MKNYFFFFTNFLHNIQIFSSMLPNGRLMSQIRQATARLKHQNLLDRNGGHVAQMHKGSILVSIKTTSCLQQKI